jgi:hypothetical protein
MRRQSLGHAVRVLRLGNMCESGGNPNFGHASTARMHQALMDGEKDQRLVARGREKAGNQHIGIDDRPDHFTPPG